MSSDTTWRNWSGAVRCTPQRLAAPTSTAEVAQVLLEQEEAQVLL